MSNDGLVYLRASELIGNINRDIAIRSAPVPRCIEHKIDNILSHVQDQLSDLINDVNNTFDLHIRIDYDNNTNIKKCCTFTLRGAYYSDASIVEDIISTSAPVILGMVYRITNALSHRVKESYLDAGLSLDVETLDNYLSRFIERIEHYLIG